jgi:hypothetical protein
MGLPLGSVKLPLKLELPVGVRSCFVPSTPACNNTGKTKRIIRDIKTPFFIASPFSGRKQKPCLFPPQILTFCILNIFTNAREYHTTSPV